MVYFASRDNRDRNGKAKQQVERIIHDEEFGEENVELVDSEWADFEKFIRQLRQRRTSNISMEAELRHVQRHPKVKSQAFYPCPPPAENGPDSSDSDDEDDPFGYIDTLVSQEFNSQTNTHTQTCTQTQTHADIDTHTLSRSFPVGLVVFPRW